MPGSDARTQGSPVRPARGRAFLSGRAWSVLKPPAPHIPAAAESRETRPGRSRTRESSVPKERPQRTRSRRTQTRLVCDRRPFRVVRGVDAVLITGRSDVEPGDVGERINMPDFLPFMRGPEMYIVVPGERILPDGLPLLGAGFQQQDDLGIGANRERKKGPVEYVL